MVKYLIDLWFSVAIVAGALFFCGAALGKQWLVIASIPAALVLVIAKRLIWPPR